MHAHRSEGGEAEAACRERDGIGDYRGGNGGAQKVDSGETEIRKEGSEIGMGSFSGKKEGQHPDLVRSSSSSSPRREDNVLGYKRIGVVSMLEVGGRAKKTLARWRQKNIIAA